MSQSRKRTAIAPKKNQKGSATAFIYGMVFGLAIALVVAFVLKKAELPFSGVDTQADIPTFAIGPNQSPPDPNASIYNKAQSSGGNGIVMVDPNSVPSSGQPVASNRFYLQVGSFRNREDAEKLKARLAFVGSEAEIAIGEVNGDIVNRVRVGPFISANEAYQARIPLTKSGFEATVVRE